MNGGILSLAMKAPETAPLASPTMSAPGTPTAIGRPHLEMNTPAITEQNVISVPTDRSMPPGDDDQRRRHGQHAVDRGRLQDVDDVGRLQEIRRGEAEHDDQDDQSRKGEQPVIERREPRKPARPPVSALSLLTSLIKPPPAPALPLRRKTHDLFLRGAARQHAGQPPLAHHRDAVAEAQHFGQFGRDHR